MDNRQSLNTTIGAAGKGYRRFVRSMGLLATSAIVALCVGSCADERPAGIVGYVEGFSGVISADEPSAVLVGRDVLSSGGSAADAATAMAFALTVTYPVGAGLGGGGACVTYNTKDNKAETLTFMPGQATGGAGVPALTRGLYALQARQGNLRWEQVVAPAENMARMGFSVSRAFAQYTSQAPAPYNGLHEGQMLVLTDLASTLSSIRQQGAGIFHNGAMARSISRIAEDKGVGITVDSLRTQLPVWGEPDKVDAGDDTVFSITQAGPAISDGAATSFVVADRKGNAVACALTMGQPFGTRKMASGYGFLFGTTSQADSYQALLQVNTHSKEFRHALAATGQGAQMVVQNTLEVLKDRAIDLGDAVGKGVTAGAARLNAASCPEGIPPHPNSCRAFNDPRGAGYSVRAGL